MTDASVSAPGAGTAAAEPSSGTDGQDLRVALFLFDCGDPESVRDVLDRAPAAALARLSEIVVMQERPGTLDAPAMGGTSLRFHRLPRDAGYGAARKAAFEYALLNHFDHVVMMRGDGVHPPEALPDLLEPIFAEPFQMVFASRELRLSESSERWKELPDVAARAFATGFENRLLGLRLRDYHSSFRVYSLRAIERIPFQLNADDRRFDAQIVIQCRVLGVPVREQAVAPVWREHPSRGAAVAEVLRAWRCAVDYRLHQLHVYRLGQYFVDEGVKYTFKRSRTGSHMQIVDAIAEGSRVLDLGCSQGLLAAPLAAKGVRVIGVDQGPREERAPDLEEYFERDLDAALELPFGREFDYVVVSDVIEHLRNRIQLLRGARRFLKENGRLIISTPNIALWFYRLSLLVGRFEYGPRGVLDETHVHFFTRATFRREVEKAGFRVVDERATSLPFEIVFESTGRSRLVRTATRVYHGLARNWPELFAYQHIILAEITTLDEEWTGAPR